MKSSTLKRVALCVLLLIIGGIWWYLLANHQFHKRAIEERFPHRPYYDSMFFDPMADFRHREKHMEDMFNDLEKDFYKEEKNLENNFWDNRSGSFDELTWDSTSQWAFHYYSNTNKNGEESSYNVNGKWNDGEEGWTITMSGTNTEWKDFSYSWTIHDGKSQWTLVDEEWNSKDLELESLDLKEIYEDSNSLSE